MENIQSENGLSIFQGSGELQLDTGAQSELEEEAVADQQRRDQELQKLLTNAFDDLYDDNDDQSTISSIPASEHNSHEGEHQEIQQDNVADRYHAALFSNTPQHPQYILDNGSVSRRYHYTNDVLAPNASDVVDSYMNRVNHVDVVNHQHDVQGAGGDSTSVSALHYQHCFRTSPGGLGSGDVPVHDDNERYRQTEIGSVEQLQVLYEVRVREVTRLTQQLESVTQKAAVDKDELLRQVAFREAEKERTQLLYQQVQSLLVDSKGKISDLEKQVSTLQATVRNLENTKSDLSEKLEASKTSVEDLHQKILLLERGSLNNTDKHLDAFLRNVQNMHGQQLKKLEDDLALAVSKLSAKELELEQQKQEAIRRQQQLEARLAEKGDTVNQMARSLEEAQRQCQGLMAQGSAQEAAHLRLKLGAADKEYQALTERLQFSQREVDTLRSELKQYETILKQELLHDVSEDTSDTLLAVGLSGDSNGHLQNELQRALLGQKLKREEIVRLTTQLETRTKEICGLQEREKQYKSQLKELEAKWVTVQEESQRHQASLTEALQKIQEQESLVEDLKRRITSQQNNITCKIQADLTQTSQALAEAQEQCDRLKKELALVKKEKDNIASASQDYSGEYLRFHEQKLAKALEECNQQHKAQMETLRAELEHTRKEGDGVKELYINVCRSKDELVNVLQKEHIRVKELEERVSHFQAKQGEANNLLQAGAVQVQAELQALKTQLDSEKAKTEELQIQKRTLLEKLETGKDNLKAAQKAITETAVLQAELLGEKSKHKSLEEHYEKELKKLSMEKEQMMQELENRTKLYATKITEEIEKAKTDALLELKKNWQEKGGSEVNATKLKQLEENHAALQQQLESAVDRHAQDTAALSRHLEQAKVREAMLTQTLAQREGELYRLKQLSENTSEGIAENTTTSDTEKIKKEMMMAFAAKLQAVQSQHRQQIEESNEKVKDETIRYCIQQIKQAEATYHMNLKKCKEVYEAEVEKLRSALADAEMKLANSTEKLRHIQTELDKERNHKESDSEWRAKLSAMEDQLKTVELKAEKMEKNLDATKAKYRAAKKAVYKYKNYTEAQKQQLEKEWERINSGFQQALNQVQHKLTKIVNKENEVCKDVN